MPRCFADSLDVTRWRWLIRYRVTVGMLAAILVATGCGGGSLSDAQICAGPYPSQITSPFVLPYGVGESFVVGQGNCGRGSHERGAIVQYAYDFLMPIGTNIIAARSGQVILVEERFGDGTRVPGQENYINIQHADGSVAGYVHLTRNGVMVSVGDHVTQGDMIGLSGDSGSSTQPHLHFHVQQAIGLPTIPITFHNTRPHPTGLLEGQSYLAEPFTPASAAASRSRIPALASLTPRPKTITQ